MDIMVKYLNSLDEAIKILHKAKKLNPNGTYLFEPNEPIMTTDSFNSKLGISS